jgi:hypothetical protein
VADSLDAAGPSLGYLRRGSVVDILERRLVRNAGNAESWVLVKEESTQKIQGWIPASVVDVYDTKGRAKTASESMSR